jgi:F0F1-type ATP synthase assembly protein I
LTKGSDASAYSLLKEIIDKTKRYGKIIGWLDKIRGSATTLQIILYSISILIGIIVSVIAVLISLGVI